MKFRRGLSCLGALVLMAFATPAIANDEGGYMDEAPQASPSDWSGFWLGIGIGSGDVDYNQNDDHSHRGYERRFKYGRFNSFEDIGDGIFATFSAGYDRQVSKRFVLGAFTDFDVSSAGKQKNYRSGWMDDRDAFIADGFFPANESTNLEHKYSWNIGGRLGMLVKDRSLIYGLVAYTRGEFNLDYGFNGTMTNGVDQNLFRETNPSRTLAFDGVTLGVGVEHMLAKNLFIKAEYRYTKFGEESIGGRADIIYGANAGYTNTVDGESFDPTMHTGRVSLVVKFNREDPVEPDQQ